MKRFKHEIRLEHGEEFLIKDDNMASLEQALNFLFDDQIEEMKEGEIVYWKRTDFSRNQEEGRYYSDEYYWVSKEAYEKGTSRKLLPEQFYTLIPIPHGHECGPGKWLWILRAESGLQSTESEEERLARFLDAVEKKYEHPVSEDVLRHFTQGDGPPWLKELATTLKITPEMVAVHMMAEQ